LSATAAAFACSGETGFDASAGLDVVSAAGCAGVEVDDDAGAAAVGVLFAVDTGGGVSAAIPLRDKKAAIRKAVRQADVTNEISPGGRTVRGPGARRHGPRRDVLVR
jgi:hypothetical protein